MLKEGHHDQDLRLVDLAVAANHLSPADSEQALAAWRDGEQDGNFGLFLVANKYLSPTRLLELTRQIKKEQAASGPAPGLSVRPTNGAANGSARDEARDATRGPDKGSMNGSANGASKGSSNGLTPGSGQGSPAHARPEPPAIVGGIRIPSAPHAHADLPSIADGAPPAAASQQLQPGRNGAGTTTIHGSTIGQRPAGSPVAFREARGPAPDDRRRPSIPSTGEGASTQEPSPREDAQELLRYSAQSTLEDLLRQAMDLGASDLHVHSGAPLTLRIGGDLRQASAAALDDAACQPLVLGALNEAQRALLEKHHQVDFAFEIEGVGRFRANAYRQQRGLDAVFRTISPQPPTLKDLGMPAELQRVADFHQGLVLFTGPAGCGKSSTMAAVVNRINQSRPDHILTIEDPVEYVHDSASCNVNQREVGPQTESFSRALRAALREDPDVIVIGELRDLETISLAITAAETGHLVLGTLHTSNAIRTINRLLAVFPPEQQAQVRVMLSESLKAVVSQRLVRRADGKGRVPALEVMFNTNAIGNLIRDNKTHQIKTILQTGGARGQRLLDASLKKLLEDKVISQEEAIRHAEEPASFE